MANTSQAPNLEGLHREIHGMAEQMRVMNEKNVCLIQLLAATNSPPPVLPPILDIERYHHSYRSGDDHFQNNTIMVEYKGDDVGRQVLLDMKGSMRTIDLFGDLSRLFVGNFMSCRIRKKNASHHFTVHQKETEGLKDYVNRFNHVVLEVEDPSDKMNVPETLSALQSKTDKYLAAEELVEAKQDCFQLKEQIANLIKKGYLRKYVTDCPSPDSPGRRYGNNRSTAGDIQVIHGRFGFGRCSSSSRKRHTRSAHGRAEEEIYNLSSPFVNAHPSITFNNDDLRGLNLPHNEPWLSRPSSRTLIYKEY
ncbi:hypothetical protein Acr_03g0012880 [Actinidia rufa]|uniref:Retrotransposon gag domain-containing protein n=1 Tax=Actinidia rufa TaxID=165716 RepID=A0A7J0EDF2_9ERIC|nr:hypothetical protein Acr_03g0012880 [Actinidia rufa]